MIFWITLEPKRIVNGEVEVELLEEQQLVVEDDFGGSLLVALQKQGENSFRSKNDKPMKNIVWNSIWWLLLPHHSRGFFSYFPNE